MIFKLASCEKGVCKCCRPEQETLDYEFALDEIIVSVILHGKLTRILLSTA